MSIEAKVNAFKAQLIRLLSDDEAICGIGQTGDVNAPLIPGKSDIDLFVICQAVPEKELRRKRYEKLAGDFDRLEMEVCAGGIWGCGDIFHVEGIDVMPMYFTLEEMRVYLEEVLAGRHLAREGRFYPIGRLASIETLNVLYEKDQEWTRLINRVKEHPRVLFDAWYAHESGCMIDEEDLGRAALRHEVLFYHQVVEAFLDHFLQALYAKNDCYFPSRKRTEDAILRFEKKPVDCYKRLIDVVRLGSDEDTIDASILELRALAQELKSY